MSCVVILLRQPQKPVLTDAIWALHTPDLPGVTGHVQYVQYVLDGGALVQRIPWTRGSTYMGICKRYSEYVTRNYGEAVVVFDGYQGTSTKDMTHRRRADLLVLLIYHANLKSHDLFFKPEAKKSTKNPRVWNIKSVKQQLGPNQLSSQQTGRASEPGSCRATRWTG
ncbi:hypothetical protein AAFF_G00264570 [Aldrovandia affinis]|uniref:Uncharacterized protein n=1 Tax=Aldrovandia affinis TaxID=143900 RepID=A0AAD7RBM0_9TELE|nr:hypothetical protein AAFF_G00264570 [Aldrovandia affinis]